MCRLMLRRRIIGLLVIVGVLIGIIVSLVWLANTGFMAVSVSNSSDSGSGLYYYSFSGNSTSAKVESESPTVKKRLKKGTYLTLVESGDKSYVKTVHVGGWLKTSSVDMQLVAEKARAFVGDEPGFCMNYSQSLLYSFDCNEPGGLKAHQPATADTPTIVVSELEPPYINLKDIITLGGQPKAFVVDPDGHSGNSGVEVYSIDQSLSFDNKVNLQGIDSKTAPRTVAYKNGFVVYSQDFSNIKLFENMSENGSDLGKIEPSLKGAKPIELSIYGDEFGALFNNSPEGSDKGLSDDNNNPAQKAGSGKSEFVLMKKNQRFKFNKLYTSGVICGVDRLCLVGNSILDIYEIKGKKAKLILSSPGVEKVSAHNGVIDLLSNKGLVVIDQKTLEGSLYYSFGSGGFCGYTISENNYIICATNEKSGTSALLIDSSKNNTDNIDKKIIKILEDDSVKDISIYKNFVFISPYLNENDYVYDPSLNIQRYDPVKLKQSTDKISSLINSSGISREQYTIINVIE